MKKIIWIITLWVASFQLKAQVAEKLQALGMENIRTAHVNNETLVAFEDNV